MKCVLLHLLFSSLLLAQPVLVAYERTVDSRDFGTLLRAITDGYIERNQLAPTEKELAPIRKLFERSGPSANGTLDFPKMIVQSWKLNRIWWGKHKGRLVLSSFGVHLATDAMLKEITELEKSGDVRFLDLDVRRKFFDHYQNYRGDGVVTGERAQKILDDGLPK